MKRIYPIITVLAAIGYLISVTLYALTFKDIDSQSLPIYSYLTFLLFGTWIIAVLKLSTSTELKELRTKKQKNPITIFKVIFNGTPLWISIIAGLSFVFAMVSFGIIMYTQKGVVSTLEGERVIHNHGDIIKTLTEEEYRHALAVQARGFVGHYLAFFSVGAAILYPEKIESNDL